LANYYVCTHPLQYNLLAKIHGSLQTNRRRPRRLMMIRPPFALLEIQTPLFVLNEAIRLTNIQATPDLPTIRPQSKYPRQGGKVRERGFGGIIGRSRRVVRILLDGVTAE